MKAAALLCAAALILVSCGADGEDEEAEAPPKPTPTTARLPATPTPQPTAAVLPIGETAHWQDNSATVVVYSFAMPVAPNTAFSPTGGELLGVADVEICGQGAARSVDPFDWDLYLADNTSQSPVLFYYEPELATTTVPPGQCARGYVAFAVPPGAASADRLVYQGRGASESYAAFWQVP